MNFNDIEWLAIQRLFFKCPKKGFKKYQAGQIDKRTLSLEPAQRDLEFLKKNSYDFLTFTNPRYPEILKQIYDPPLVLQIKGNWPVWEEKRWIAVVGARKASRFGLEMTDKIVEELARENVGIVSGLAYGIDSRAHLSALRFGAPTWGVLGSAIDQLYPKRHAKLAQEMTQQGGYLSEFPVGTTPLGRNFVQRNRIISGLSSAVIVVEAAVGSGSLITAQFALEQGKEVFVVEPPKDNVAYEGSRLLLEEGANPYEGAKQVLELTDAFKNFGERPKKLVADLFDGSCRGVSPHRAADARCDPPSSGPTPRHPSNRSANPLLKLLKIPHSLDDLIQSTHKSPHVLLVELVNLEADGLIKKLPGSLWQSL